MHRPPPPPPSNLDPRLGTAGLSRENDVRKPWNTCSWCCHNTVSVFICLSQHKALQCSKHVRAAEQLCPQMQQPPKWDALHNETTWYNVSKVTSADSHTLYYISEDHPTNDIKHTRYAVSLTGLTQGHHCRFRPLLHSLTVVTTEWLTLRHSCITATNMACYSLPLWNPVLRKVVLPIPWRHNGGAEVQLHSFLTLTLEKSGQLHAPATLPPGKNPHTLWLRGWVVPQPVWTFQRKEKSHGSTGVRNPYLAACSTVTIAHSVTQTSNQHTPHSTVCIMYCT
jgi:hypothetical protein